MGLLDYYQGKGTCSNCGASWDCDGQTEFFDPHMPFGARTFTTGDAIELAYSLERQASRRVWIHWFRVHDRGEPDRLTLLASLEDIMWCECETVVIEVLHFRFADGPPPTATLERIELRDARSPKVADGVDFADAERLVWHDRRPDDVPIEELAAAPLEERVARLRAALAVRIAELWP